MKKLISIFLMAMLLMTTVPFTTLANGDLLEVYNSATGEATYETPMNANVQQMYTDLRYYSSTSTGTRSTSADINTGAASAIGWGSGKGNYVTFMRFPLSAVAVAEGKRIDSVTLNVTFAEAYDFTSSNRVLAAYKDFTTTTLGETISYLDKTYSDLTANTNLVGSVELNKSYAASDTVSIDVTDYVRSLVDAGASSADFALTIPDADAQYKIYPVQYKFSSESNVKLKPHLTVGTVYYVPENGGQVSITDSVADGLSLYIYFEKEGYYYITTTGCGNGESNAKLSLNGDDAVENILKHDEVGEYMIGDPFILNEGMNNVEISLMDASNTEAQLTKISFKPNQAPVFDKSDISSTRPLVGESVSLAVSAVDLESGLEKVSYKVIPEGADEEDINEEEMTLENGEYTADITFSDIGKYSVKLFAYDECGAKCEKTLYVNSVDVKAENAAVTEETVSDGIKLTGELDFYNNSGTEKKVTLIIAVYDENNMMIAQENVAADLTASVDAQPISVETLFQPPATGTWSAELMLWDSLLDMNSLSDVTEHN